MNTFVATRQYARAKFPHLTRDIDSYDYAFKVTKEDEPSGGSSMGLPTALAFLSLFVQRPVRTDFASSGELVTDAHNVLVIRGVGDVEHKVRGAYHRDLQGILLPRDNQKRLEESALVPRAVSRELVRYVASLDEAVQTVFSPDLFR